MLFQICDNWALVVLVVVAKTNIYSFIAEINIEKSIRIKALCYAREVGIMNRQNPNLNLHFQNIVRKSLANKNQLKEILQENLLIKSIAIGKTSRKSMTREKAGMHDLMKNQSEETNIQKYKNRLFKVRNQQEEPK